MISTEKKKKLKKIGWKTHFSEEKEKKKLKKIGWKTHFSEENTGKQVS